MEKHGSGAAAPAPPGRGGARADAAGGRGAWEPGEIPDLTQFTLEQLVNVDVAGVSLETSVPGAHTHYAGEWMISNEYMLMGGVENLDGTREVPVPVILQRYRTTPISMTHGGRHAQVHARAERQAHPHGDGARH